MSLQVLDCTFRDGGYYNQWDFDLNLVNKYLSAVQSAGINAIEIGFRFSPKLTFYGPFAYSTDSFLRTLDLPSDVAIGVMVNGSDIATYPIKKMFSSVENAPIDRVRIALHFTRIHECEAAAKELKSLGYEVGVNLMQAGGKSSDQIREACRIITHWGVDFLYFADSLGDMNPTDIVNVLEVMRSEWNGPLGFHGHDNKGQALNNTWAAIESGATWVDSTILGMGRGAGNTRTEYLLAELQAQGLPYSPDPLFSLALEDFSKLHEKYKWGHNLLYYLSAMRGIHPTYIQEMTSSLKYSVPVMLDGIKKLGSAKPVSNSYNKQLLVNALAGDGVTVEGTWTPSKALGWTKGRDALVIASGTGARRHQKALIQYIQTTSPLVICLNSSTEFPNEHVDIYAVCNQTRLLVESEKYKIFGKPILTPSLWVVEQDWGDLKILDYGIKVRSHKWEPNHTACIIPGLLVAAYVFAALAEGGAKRIILAGFDGYETRSELQEPMAEVFDLYRGPPLMAITPTSYNILQRSVHEPEFTGR